MTGERQDVLPSLGDSEPGSACRRAGGRSIPGSAETWLLGGFGGKERDVGTIVLISAASAQGLRGGLAGSVDLGRGGIGESASGHEAHAVKRVPVTCICQLL